MSTDVNTGFPKLLLNISLILAAIMTYCIANDVKISHRLPNNTKPLHYNIHLILDLEKDNFIFYGETSVNIVILHASSSICLHSQELEINRSATTLIHDISGTIFKPVKYIDDNATNILTLYFNQVLSDGLYTLNMKFIANISEGSSPKQSFMKIQYTEGNVTFAATSFYPNKARRMFPCWDEPALKATFNISVKHYRKYKVLSNMPMQNQVMEQDGLLWTHFKETPIMSTYLVAIVIESNLVAFTSADQTVTLWCRWPLSLQILFAHDFAKRIGRSLIEYIHSSEVISKIDHIMVHDYPINALENWGLIIYNESSITYNNGKDPTFHRIKVASLIAQEVVYQWFGNIVTPSWWSYRWLSDGFAVFFQAYFLDQIYDWPTMDFLVIHQLHNSLALDTSILDSITLKFDYIPDYDDFFSYEIRDKAAVILRMLHHVMSDKVFQKGIITYITKHQFGSVTPDDLWSAMQSALEEAPNILYMDENFKIKEAMDTWINQNHYPVLNVTRNYETGDVEITQKDILGTESNKWWIPITFASQEDPDFTNTMPYRWLGPDETVNLQIYPSDWLIVNVQQTAYCRVYYDFTNWRKIIIHLNSEEYMDIHVLNRAQIINDAFAFLQENKINGSMFIHLVNYLSRERDYVAWYPMFQILTWLSKYFPLPESEEFQSHMIRILDGFFSNVGYEEDSNHRDTTKMLKLEAAKWACTIGSTTCRRMANFKLNKHLANPDTHKILPWWQDWTYCFGLTIANRTTWDKMFEFYQQKPNKESWKMLACAEDPDIVINYLNIIAMNTTLFHDEEHLLIFRIILEKHARNDLILEYILDNFDTLKPRSATIDLAIEIILWNVFSNEQIDKVKRFLEINYVPDSSSSLLDIQMKIQSRKDNLKIVTDDVTKLLEDIE